MPVFISYNHKDREFVTRLAKNLVRNKAHVWLDEWEVAAGESLIENIQAAIQGASALVAVFSKASIASVWCKREVIAAIQKELEERRVVVIPALLEDCDIPLFLRDKKYADFRTDFDVGLQSVLVGIAKVTNASLGRIEADEYYTDWSIDWGYLDGQFLLEFTLLQHSIKWPYTVLSKIIILCSPEATTRYKPYEDAGLSEVGHLVITESVLTVLEGHEFQVLLEDSHRKSKEITIQDPNTGIGYALTLESRRLGEDTGRDILMHGADELRKIRAAVKNVLKPLSEKERLSVQQIVQRNMARNPKKMRLNFLTIATSAETIQSNLKHVY
jgi:hypothetical protein